MFASNGLPIAASDLRHLGLGLGQLDKDDVGSGLGIGNAPADRLVETLSGPCIGARDNEKIGARTAVRRDPDLSHHVGDRDDAPVRRMAAFLGKLLILDLDCGDAGLLVATHGVADIQEPAIAGIGIGDDGRPGHFRDPPDAVDHLRVAGKTRVRQAERGRDRAVPRDVQGLETHAVGDEGGDQLEHAWRGDETALLDFLPQRWRCHGVLFHA